MRDDDGVHYCKKRKKWRAQIIREGKREFLGYFIERDDALAARRAAELRYPDRGVRGRSMRRYPAPPGMRACANPDCTNGTDGQRTVLPEDQFPKCGKYRKPVCPACDRAASRAFKKEEYTRNPELHIERNKRWRQQRQAKRHAERAEQLAAARRALDTLKAQRWSNRRIAAALGVCNASVSSWRQGIREPRPATTNRLIILASAVTHESCKL